MRLMRIVRIVLGLMVTVHLSAQNIQPKMERMVAKTATVCYGLAENAFTQIDPPQEYLAWKKNPGARIKTANITVEYVGFTDQAKAAFQAAVDIWATLIYSPVPIRIHAEWTALASGVLGSASPYTLYRNFPGAQKDGIWYPVALAEKIAGEELNSSTEPDIFARFNSAQTAWYYGTGSITGKYDLTSVVLHEIGHGLGITHSYEVSSGLGQVQSAFGIPVVFESYIQNSTAQNLVESFESPSALLGSQITGGNLFFRSPLVTSVSSLLARIYAPTTYSAGSSVAHLDENTYPAGNKNSLMTPFFNAAEKNHSPGPLVMAILKDMGWNNLLIQHTPLRNTENVVNSYSIKTQIKSDSSYDASSIKLFYSFDGTNFENTSMTAINGLVNGFEATIPPPINPSQVTTISYYMSANDGIVRTFSNPGTTWQQGSAAHTHVVYQFTAGPDIIPPHITHTPVRVVRDTDTQVNLTTTLTDNIGIRDGSIEYLVNSSQQSSVLLNNINGYPDSTYQATITFNVSAGDTIYYRITARDSSVAINTASSPFYKIAVMPTVKKYQSDFNSSASDFIGDDLFSITTPNGFSTPAIHTSHPYPESNPSDSISYSFILKYPIKLQQAGFATLKFDEIVLVEPGTTGSTWPDPGNFFDYVIVEGSKDNSTWHTIVKGYDSRDQSVWLSKWNSNVDADGNSLAVGDPALYKTRTIDMLASGYFKAGESIFIRFRLMSDQLAYGWGWAIDNLKIQIDETPPAILHDVVDFVYYKSSSVDINAIATDYTGVKDFEIMTQIANEGSVDYVIGEINGQYHLSLDLSSSNLKDGDEIVYQIIATDSIGNKSTLPQSGYFKIVVMDFKDGKESYVSNFNSANTDFAGNFFSIVKSSGFNSSAINSVHPYANGFGLDKTSSYNYILKKPIVLNSSNPKMFFREVVIAEYTGASVVDYAVVEGSKDKGVTWHPFLSPYASNGIAVWQNAFNAKANGTESMYKYHEIDLTQSGDFVAGDSVVVRFRLFANDKNNGWGWAIDDLSIQGTITAVEDLPSKIAVYPNPVASEYLTLQIPKGTKSSSFEMVNVLGQYIMGNELDTEISDHSIYVGNLQGGIYLVKVKVDQQAVTKKIVVSR